MAKLMLNKNPLGQSAVLTAEGVVVGWISLTGKNTFTAQCADIPAIDGISGNSVDAAWDAIKLKINQGNVVLKISV